MKYDVIVIGGGPAGMMAAGAAAAKDRRVLLLEKNDELGKKLLITGGGRCNLTNAEFDTRKFLAKLGKSGQFLHSTFAQFDVQDTLGFFEKSGLKIKIEEHKRAFPADNRASSVRDVLMKQLKNKNNKNVEIETGVSVAGFTFTKNKITGVKLKNGEVLEAKSFILATGGTSHPETGSTGDAYAWLREIGHKIITPAASLVPIAIREFHEAQPRGNIKELQGVTLDEVKISVFQNNEKQLSKKGRLLFTHFGLSGPMIINAGREIGELLKWGEVIIKLDLLPALDYAKLNLTLQNLFEQNKNKLLKNVLPTLLPGKISDTLITLANINPETPVHSVTKIERLKLVELIKNLPLTVSHLLSPEKAIVTSGGVDCTEVDWKTMRSRLYPNLLFAGDILDIERPSGGYSLQICWSTGYVAGNSC